MLHLQDVTAGYGGIPIVRGVSLAVEEGQVVALIGRNGVGKTTLMKAIAGVLPTMAGRIHFMGEEITGSPAYRRARKGIGYVPQGRGIFVRLSVEENLVLGQLVGSGPDRDSQEAVYAMFPRLRERRKHNGGTLSGGEQQMLAIGRILMGSPHLLVLDEPSEGLQPSIVLEIAETIRDLSNDREDLAVLLVEQNVEFVRRAADVCNVMEKGEIVATLPPSALDDPNVARRYLAL